MSYVYHSRTARPVVPSPRPAGSPRLASLDLGGITVVTADIGPAAEWMAHPTGRVLVLPEGASPLQVARALVESGAVLATGRVVASATEALAVTR